MNTPDLSIDSPYGKIESYELGLRPYDAPTPLFKYMEKRWAQDVIEKGSIQILTASGYRDLVATGETRDISEGLQRMDVLDADLPLEDPFSFSGWDTFAPDAIGDSTTNSLCAHNKWQSTGSNLSSILCFTPLLDDMLMKELDPKYDCVLQINSPVGFFITIARYLISTGFTQSPFLGKCSYNGSSTFRDKISGKERLMPRALMKRSDHSHHEEVRMVFPTKEVSTVPLKITIPEIRSYVSIVTL